MQNVTDHAFLHVLARLGPPDYFFTEYFAAHLSTCPDPEILRTLEENRTGRPVFAQILGSDPDALVAWARQLEEGPTAGIDLNLGCPAPKIYKRNAGGGLLRDTVLVDEIIGRLRESLSGLFSVKCRLGFEDAEPFMECVESVRRHRVDFLTIHGRTVRQMYRGEVDYERMKNAVQVLKCPVFANGNLTSAPRALEILAETGCRGAMIGRSAIRNPWIFRQIRELSRGLPPFEPCLSDVRDYIEQLYRAKIRPGVEPRFTVAHLKRYLIFVGEGVDADGAFLHAIRRVRDEKDLFTVCDEHLLLEGRGELQFASEPFPGLTARPNQE